MMKPIGNRLLIKNWPEPAKEEGKIFVSANQDPINKKATIIEVSIEVELRGLRPGMDILYDPSEALIMPPMNVHLINYENILCVL